MSSGFASLFKFGFKSGTAANIFEIAPIFPLDVAAHQFIEFDIISTYTNILTDVAERTSGLTEHEDDALWDSCLQGDAGKGLITLLAEAMYKMNDLYLVWNRNGSGVLRKADPQEQQQIRADYEAQGESPFGVYVSFSDYKRTRMFRIYSNFEYCLLTSLHKTLNLSMAMQLKISDLRQSISNMDSEAAEKQAKDIAEALRKGSDVLIDSGDTIETASPDTSSAEKALDFLTQKKSLILRMPESYINGEQAAGIGSSGEGDNRAIEKGLRHYFASIIKPVFRALFQKDVSFKTEDFRQITTGLEALRAFTLVGTEHIPAEIQRDIIIRIFNLDPSEVEAARKAEEKADAQRVRDLPPPPQFNEGEE